MLSSHTNMGPEYLLNIPVHIFHLYIKMFNTKAEDEDAERHRSNMMKKDVNELPKMVGNTIPKKPSS